MLSHLKLHVTEFLKTCVAELPRPKQSILWLNGLACQANTASPWNTFSQSPQICVLGDGGHDTGKVGFRKVSSDWEQKDWTIPFVLIVFFCGRCYWAIHSTGGFTWGPVCAGWGSSSLGCAQSLFMELGLRRESVSNRELPKILEGGEWSRWYFRNMTNLIPHYYLLFITEVWQVWCQCLLQEWLVCFAQFPSLGHICEH